MLAIDQSLAAFIPARGCGQPLERARIDDVANMRAGGLSQISRRCLPPRVPARRFHSSAEETALEDAFMTLSPDGLGSSSPASSFRRSLFRAL